DRFAPTNTREISNKHAIQWRLKYCTAFSCFFAAARVLNVPRFRRFPVFGFFFREYKRYWPSLSFLITCSSVTNPEGKGNNLAVQSDHSARSARIGLIVDDRRAGIHTATDATASSTMPIP